MTDRLPISVFIIAKNEADRIPLTIDSVRDWVDEIIVIDSGSEDDTVRVAESLGAQVTFKEWEGYGPQKVFGETLCRNDWILNLDADEEITPELAREIQALFAGDPPCSAYRLQSCRCTVSRTGAINGPRHTGRCGSTGRAGPVSRTAPCMTRSSCISGATGSLKGMVNHRSFRSLAHHVEKVNSYSSAQAADLHRRGRNPSRIELFIVPVLAFLKQYLLRREFVNGIDGVIISYMYAFQRFIRLAKTREKFQIAKRQGNGE